MKKTVKASITWVTVEQGGRETMMPVGIKYYPIIVFNAEQNSDISWSAEMYNTQLEGRTSIADVSYLVDDAPFHLLQSGNAFSLYEGQRMVAEGVVQ